MLPILHFLTKKIAHEVISCSTQQQMEIHDKKPNLFSPDFAPTCETKANLASAIDNAGLNHPNSHHKLCEAIKQMYIT